MVAGGLEALAGRIGRVVRAMRMARSQSLGDLARASGLSKTILARIERGDGNPSIETLWRLSQALDVPLGALIDEDAGPRVRMIPARSGEHLRSDDGVSAWLLHAEGREHRAEVFELEWPAGVDHRSDPHLAGTEELVVCTAGRIAAGPVGGEEELRPGDAVWFAADVPHRYRALEASRALNWIAYHRAGGAA